MRELRDRRDGGRVIATRRPLLATFGTRVDFGMAGEGVTAMIVAADAGDNPLADRREDLKAAAERERKAKVAKVASQATNAMAAVRAQLGLREKGAADKAANKANDDAGAPVRASSTMLERVFAAGLDGPDKYVVARRKERKTAGCRGWHCCRFGGGFGEDDGLRRQDGEERRRRSRNTKQL